VATVAGLPVTLAVSDPAGAVLDVCAGLPVTLLPVCHVPAGAAVLTVAGLPVTLAVT
jgi:hypothetical protein